MFKCNICEKTFTSKFNMERHHNKKIKCNIITTYQCSHCKRYFKYNKNLLEHISKDVCNSSNTTISKNTDIQLYSNEEKKVDIVIKSILKSKLDDTKKSELLNDHLVISNDKLNTILNSGMTLDEQVINLSLYNKNTQNGTKISANINNGNITNETNSHNNITNNIQINNFGKEDISYLDNEYFKNLIMNQHIENGYVQLIKDIYLNKEHPENGTIKVENLNNKYAHVYKGGKWDTILKYDLREQMHKKNYTILKMHYDKLKKAMSLPKKEETYVFLARDELSDPHMMYVIDKIILLFYNEGEGDEMPDKYKINNNK